MRLKTEDELLNPGVRVKVIEDIEGTENQARKDEAFRRWQVYKDKTADFVVELLLNQFDETTVREMGYSITNISICRKIVNKLARVYTHGVARSISDDEAGTEAVEGLEDNLNLNQKMKRSNRMLKLQRNALLYVKPCPYMDSAGNMLNRVRVSPTNPYLYDVIEEYYDRTECLAYIFSNYSPGSLLYTSRDPATVRDHGPRVSGGISALSGSGSQSITGDGRDQSIADKKEDEGKDLDSKMYVVWTDKYHFTMNEKGTILDPNGVPIDISTEEGLEQIINPFGMKPAVNLAIDQDNSYWAEGGEDLVDSSIVINSLFTQANHIAVVQGYGQFYATGKNLPKNITSGPNKAIILEHEEDDPVPKVGFINANPPLDELRAQIESQVALALTTNDLSVSGVSATLDSTGMAPSGVSLIIDKSESQEDVKDQRDIFVDAERELWQIIAAELQHFNEEGNLDPEQAQYALPETVDLQIDFSEPDSVMSEGEKLDNIKKRKELGLNTQAELIQKDRGTLSTEEAEVLVAAIVEESKKRMESFSVTESDDEDDDKDPNKDDDGDKG